jgi:hypothetical protein
VLSADEPQAALDMVGTYDYDMKLNEALVRNRFRAEVSRRPPACALVRALCLIMAYARAQ